jgi:predicted  nucleic acid-binding Zn-ribbon protein
MKKTALIKYKGKPVFVAPVVDLELRDFVSKQKEAEVYLDDVLKFKEAHDQKLLELEKEVAELKKQIKILKGEDDELGND